jgi:hypothetical protein
MLRSSNYLDTRTAGSYNRRPLSLGTLPGQLVDFSFCISDPSIYRVVL